MNIVYIIKGRHICQLETGWDRICAWGTLSGQLKDAIVLGVNLAFEDRTLVV